MNPFVNITHSNGNRLAFDGKQFITIGPHSGGGRDQWYRCHLAGNEIHIVPNQFMRLNPIRIFPKYEWDNWEAAPT